MSGLNTNQFSENDDYVFLPAANGSFNAVRRAEEHLNIQQIVEKQVGTWYSVSDSESFRVWDGETWLEFPKLLPVKLGILPHNMTERFNAEEIEYLVEVHAEMTDEEDRLALRQLLAEQQNGE